MGVGGRKEKGKVSEKERREQGKEGKRKKGRNGREEWVRKGERPASIFCPGTPSS